MYRVNVILAAVKAVQNVVGHIRQHYECSCFVSSKREAVYTMNLSVSAGGGAVSRRITPVELAERSGRIGSMVESMMSDSDPVARNCSTRSYWTRQRTTDTSVSSTSGSGRQ